MTTATTAAIVLLSVTKLQRQATHVDHGIQREHKASQFIHFECEQVRHTAQPTNDQQQTVFTDHSIDH